MTSQFRSALMGSAALLGLALGGAAQAQESVGLEEIVVTAERRVTDVQRTPLAITAVSGDSLERQDVNNANDLQRIVPALNVVSNTSFPNIYINGVGGGVSNLYGTPTVAYNLDGVALGQAYGAAGSFYDLQRVEVLKGPQGTLYGRNATGGAINILPNTPVLGAYEGAIGVQIGNYDHTEFNGMVNLPLTDTMAARVAFYTVNHDGYLSNGTSDADQQSVRGQLLWEPSDTLSIRLAADYFQNGGKGPGEVPLYPGRSFTGRPALIPGYTGLYLNPDDKWTALSPNVTYPTCAPPGVCQIAAAGGLPQNSPAINASIPARLSPSGSDPFQDVSQLQLAAHIDWDIGFATLTVIPAYVKTDVEFLNYQNLRQGRTVQEVEQTSLEARLTSNGEGPLKWVLGAYYYDQSLYALNAFFQENIGYGGYFVPDLQDTAYAVFGQGTWSFTDAFRVTVGLRYTREEGSQNGFALAPAIATPAFIAANPTVGNVQGYIPSRGSLEDDAVTGLLRAEWDWREQSMLYASVSTGFKAGGFNPGTSENTFPPEEITAYEIGSKNRFFDNRVQINATAFYWDYRNQQVQQNYGVQPCPNQCFAFSVIPVEETHIWGIEFDTQWLVTDTTRIGFDIVRQEGVFDKYQTRAVPILNAPALTYNGNDRAFTPHWKADLSLEQTFPLPDGADLVFFGNVHWQTEQALVNNINPAHPRDLVYMEDYTLSNASLTYRRENWEAGVYVNNIENTFIRQSFAVASMYGGISTSPGAPRTYGVRLNARFGGAEAPVPPPPPAMAPPPPPAPAPQPAPAPAPTYPAAGERG